MNLRPQALLHSRLEAFAYKQRTTLWCEITHQPETHTRIPCLSASGLGQMSLQNTTNITLYTFTITTNFACTKPKPSLSLISVSSMCYFTALLCVRQNVNSISSNIPSGKSLSTILR